jgi:hypothetical protein
VIQDIVVAHRQGRELMPDLVRPSTGTGPWPPVVAVRAVAAAYAPSDLTAAPPPPAAEIPALAGTDHPRPGCSAARPLIRPTVGAA